MYDIDSITEVLTKSIVQDKNAEMKAQLRKKLSSITEAPISKDEVTAAIKAEVASQMASTTLAKNEVMASAFDNGSVKMDFGAEVPESVKKAALKWAENRGLAPLEASLKKNANSSTSVLFGTQNPAKAKTCVKRLKWSV
jgi:hypothetical protein